ncbi:MAG TPA: hypothetical protein VJK49_05125 [Candidatus Limnocylindrales bacterium]|nr:hypothetical protein [Candidatus Limnocylindrales bacterium]
MIVLAHAGIGLLPDHETVMFLLPALPVLLIATIVLGATLEQRGAFGPAGRMVSVGMPLAVIAAALSLAAAGIHFAVIQEHLEVDLAEGLFFFGLGWFQLIWAQVYLLRAHPRVAAVAVWVNVAVVLTWFVSRTIGLPLGAQPWVPEPVGLADLLATSFEVGLIGLLLPSLAPERFARVVHAQLPVQKAFVLAAFMIVTVSLLTGLALVPGAFELLSF